jgi:hypothetical protein
MGDLDGDKWGMEEALIDAVHMLGLLYTNQDRLQEAEAMYQRVLQGKEKALGPDTLEF